MSLLSAPLSIAVPLLVLLGLTGCTAQPTPDETFAPVPDSSDTPVPAVTPNPIEPDMTLRVEAIATAPNGAQLALDMQVHLATSFDYIGTQTLPAAIIEDCGGTLDLEIFAAEQWSFTRVNVTAIPTDASTGDWPSDLVFTIEPSAKYAKTAGRGMLAGDPANAQLCVAEKQFAGAGRGGLALGTPGDAGVFTAWAEHAYGFTLTGGTLSDCTIEGTELGAQYGGNPSAWVSAISETNCSIGPETQTNEY